MPKIFESPDGGETVYSRESGTNERVLFGESDKARSKMDQLREDKLWGNIRRKAKVHPGMRAELERVIMFYNLIKDNE